MESFEPIFKSSDRLHDESVFDGAGAFNPISLVGGGLRKLKLELVWLQSGDPALKGAKALFDEQSGAVLCEMAGEPADRAQLVAHEIGHASLHARSFLCSAIDIDASRSIEAAPVGLQ